MSDDLQARIVEQIRINRISTTEIADCLGKQGLYAKARPLMPGYFRAGPVFYAYAFDESNHDLHIQVRDTPPGSILVVDAIECGERALFGSLVAKFLMLYRKTEAIVTDGLLRDAPRLLKERWPIWCAGVTPIGCFNAPSTRTPDPEDLAARRARLEGAIAVCDDSGVVLIPKERQNDAFLDRLAFIERQEDAWFFCIDTLKWDTYRTVCEKDYLNDPRLMALLGDLDPGHD